jgi:hypothetical protein
MYHIWNTFYSPGRLFRNALLVKEDGLLLMTGKKERKWVVNLASKEFL